MFLNAAIEAVDRSSAISTIDVSVIVPTYCEAENLPELAERIFHTVSRANLSSQLIVVDDDSPDRTYAVCCELRDRFPLQLLVRKGKRGLSSAVIEGLNEAVGSILIVMDGDLSHSPEAIPALVESLKRYQFVVGSRYIKGASTDYRWGLMRKWLSRVATLMVRPLTPVSDPMSGFFAISQRSFRGVADKLSPLGYKIALEMIVKLECREVGEVPIFFSQRKHGRSKLSLHVGIQFLKHLIRLYKYRLG